MPRQDGSTLRDHLEVAETATGERLIEDPEIPAAGEHLWNWFWELHSGRGGGFGPSPLSYQELAAWARLTGSEPGPWEVRALRKMDNACLAALAANQKKKAS